MVFKLSVHFKKIYSKIKKTMRQKLQFVKIECVRNFLDILKFLITSETLFPQYQKLIFEGAGRKAPCFFGDRKRKIVEATSAA